VGFDRHEAFLAAFADHLQAPLAGPTVDRPEVENHPTFESRL
jgi:hypothetical protein